MNNSFGKILRVTIFGASHEECVGIRLDGVPSGICLTEELFEADLSRRRPSLGGETPRREADIPAIEGLDAAMRTTGEPLVIRFANGNTRSTDYSHLERQPRPSHADLVQRRKYGAGYSLAGGGIASGRMTVALVAAGVVAKQLLPNVEFRTRLVEVGGCSDSCRFEEIIRDAARDGDSVGGRVECIVSGVPTGIGEPFFDSVESVASHLLFSIPAVKGVEFGAGFEVCRRRGSENNDLIINADGKTATNNDGGINGGISNGNPIKVSVAFKPTASISREQHSINLESGEVGPMQIRGRHDACIALRGAVVVESVMAITLASLGLKA